MHTDEIDASPHWRRVDFISDVHLHSSGVENFLALTRYLETSHADAIFILGDLFDVWVGDDVLKDCVNEQNAVLDCFEFERECMSRWRDCTALRKVYFLHGNRDFLLGQDFAHATGMTFLSDPCTLILGGERYLLSHGDALCVDDLAYQAFRRTVRDPVWQTDFLSSPLEYRREQAQQMRMRSEQIKASQRENGQAWVDVNVLEAVRWMNQHRCRHLIHGHTHEGKNHTISSEQGMGMRFVLPDWHVEHVPPQGFVLSLQVNRVGQWVCSQVPLV